MNQKNNDFLRNQGPATYTYGQSAGASQAQPSSQTGTYGNPTVTYHGPGLHTLLQGGDYATRFDEKTGKIGIVLGKYTRS